MWACHVRLPWETLSTPGLLPAVQWGKGLTKAAQRHPSEACDLGGAHLSTPGSQPVAKTGLATASRDT